MLSQENAASNPLHAALSALPGNRAGWVALRIHLSRMAYALQHAAIRKLAERPYCNLASHCGGQLLRLDNGDIILIGRGFSETDLDAAAAHLSVMQRSESPIDPARSSPAIPLVSRFDLSDLQDWEAIIDLASDCQIKGNSEPDHRGSNVAPKPLDARLLAKICAKLQQGLSHGIIHQQTALALKAGGAIDPLFREIYVSIHDLAQWSVGKVDMFAVPSLFRYLTEVLDTCVLRADLSPFFQDPACPLSLNLNISTLGTDAFHQFHAQWSSSSRPVIEIALPDILSNVTAFETVRDRLRRDGYKIVIDVVRPFQLPLLRLETLGADYVKILWEQPGTSGELLPSLKERVDAVAAIGRSKVIAARVESKTGLEWALEMGITRFQGRFIDKLLRAVILKES